jgi:hypothetical protein
MAIDRIPGVGPANSDIAAAVAAPSAATIAAAVAAPSAATIASTVAAPSAATIATAVAAAVPTTAGITSIVQANAGSPFGGTYTQIANSTPSNVDTTTISGLGSYKYLKIHFYIYNSGSSSFTLDMRFNGDTGSNYFTNNNYILASGTTGIISTFMNRTAGYLFPATGNATAETSGTVEIRDNNATNIFKDARIWGGTTTYGGARTTLNGQTVYISSSVISSVTFFTSNTCSGNIRIWGSN